MREINGGEEDGIEPPQRRDGAGGLRRGDSMAGTGGHGLVHWSTGRPVLRLQRERAESLLVLREVVAENIHQRLGLLRTEVDALEVFNLNVVGGILVHRPEDEEEIPDAHTDLDAVGVAVAVLVGLFRCDVG